MCVFVLLHFFDVFVDRMNIHIIKRRHHLLRQPNIAGAKAVNVCTNLQNKRTFVHFALTIYSGAYIIFLER